MVRLSDVVLVVVLVPMGMVMMIIARELLDSRVTFGSWNVVGVTGLARGIVLLQVRRTMIVVGQSDGAVIPISSVDEVTPASE